MEEKLSDEFVALQLVNSLRVVASDAASSLTRGHLMGLHPE
jgi:hypothetical protein